MTKLKYLIIYFLDEKSFMVMSNIKEICDLLDLEYFDQKSQITGQNI